MNLKFKIGGGKCRVSPTISRIAITVRRTADSEMWTVFEIRAHLAFASWGLGLLGYDVQTSFFREVFTSQFSRLETE